jgi:hypothetical protein
VSPKSLVNIFSSGGVGPWLMWLGRSRLYLKVPKKQQLTCHDLAISRWLGKNSTSRVDIR